MIKGKAFREESESIRHGKIDDLNLDQLYERMKIIKEKNQKVLEAKKLLMSNEEPESKKLPQPHKTNGQDSTS